MAHCCQPEHLQPATPETSVKHLDPSLTDASVSIRVKSNTALEAAEPILLHQMTNNSASGDSLQLVSYIGIWVDADLRTAS